MQRADKKAKYLRAYKSGLLAEYLAALYIFCKGYRLLGHRYKTPQGEIDLIARHKNTLVFIEVKKRRTRHEALSAIAPKNAARVRRAAQNWLALHPAIAHKYDIRFDVVAFAPYAWPIHLTNGF